MLPAVPEVLFIDGVGDFRRLTSEVIVFSMSLVAKGVVVENVIGVIQLISQAIIRILKINAISCLLNKLISALLVNLTDSPLLELLVGHAAARLCETSKGIRSLKGASSFLTSPTVPG